MVFSSQLTISFHYQPLVSHWAVVSYFRPLCMCLQWWSYHRSSSAMTLHWLAYQMVLKLQAMGWSHSAHLHCHYSRHWSVVASGTCHSNPTCSKEHCCWAVLWHLDSKGYWTWCPGWLALVDQVWAHPQLNLTSLPHHSVLQMLLNYSTSQHVW